MLQSKSVLTSYVGRNLQVEVLKSWGGGNPHPGQKFGDADLCVGMLCQVRSLHLRKGSLCPLYFS